MKQVSIGVFIFFVVISLIGGFSGGYFYYGKFKASQTDSPNNNPGATVSTSPSGSADQYSEYTFDNLLVKLNDLRIANGLTTIGTDNYLSKIAQSDLVNNCPVTSHQSFRDDSDKGLFKNYNEVSEELQSGALTPEQALSNLMDSPTHKEGLLDKSYTRVGIGVSTTPVNCVSFIFGK